MNKDLVNRLTIFSFFFLLSSLSFGQKLLWNEEFNYEGFPADSSWSYDVGDHGWGNNELQFYTKEELKNARVENGKLIIEVHQDSDYPKGYTSARLVSKKKASWQYGYIEVSAKLPSGIGTWPAIWMLADENRYGGWPKNGEIDIMEHVGYDPGVVHGTVHTESFNHVKGTQKGAQMQVDSFNSAFHTYAIDWNEEKIDFFIDDQLYFTFENTGGGPEEWPFSQPFHIILNIAVGGNWGGKEGVDPSIWPQRMEIDYIRVYEYKPTQE